MRRLGVLLAIGGVACGNAPAGQREFDGDSAFAYVSAQLAFGPRIPNTEGHRRMGDWLERLLRDRADSVTVQAFTHLTGAGDTLRLRNFIAHFRPRETDRILYIAHWDTRPHADQSPNPADRTLPVPGANDGASGVALLLGVADALHARPPTLGVDLAFVDGEDFGDFDRDRDVLLGSRHLAATINSARRPLFAVLWDMIGDRDLEIFQDGYSVSGAPEVVERVWTRAEELGYGHVFRSSVGYSLIDDHIPLLRAGVRAIDVIDFQFGPGNGWWHTTEDTLDKVSAQSLRIVGEVAVALLR
jgi:glutaminyl-peptide cyclotransferase